MLLRLVKRPCSFPKTSCAVTRFNNHRTFAYSPPRRTDAPEIYDVVCVGGGPAGLGLLNALRASEKTAGLKIALIEGQDLQRGKQQFSDISGYSNRCSSLTPASVKFLSDIGAWEHVNSERVQQYHSIEVLDGVSGSSVTFDPFDTPVSSVLDTLFPKPKNADTSAMATMTENPNLTSGLLSRMATLPSIEILDKTRVEGISLGEETEEMDLSSWPVVSLQGTNRKLAARLLVGADGANSPVRTFVDIKSRGWDYDRHGVVATLQMTESKYSHKTAYQRFLPTGPIAILPLPDNTASLVWSTTPGYAAHLKSLSPPDFIAMVNAAFRLLPVDLAFMHTLPSGQTDELSWRLQNTSFSPSTLPTPALSVQEGSIASFPLRMRHADTYVGHRVALIGDAAHTIHPLAGQGLNQGLGDAASLSKHILSALDVGADIGTNWTLDAYNAEQWSKNNAMLGAVDKLHKLYSAGSGPVVWGRSIGLDVVDRLGWVKGAFMRTASGSGR